MTSPPTYVSGTQLLRVCVFHLFKGTPDRCVYMCVCIFCVRVFLQVNCSVGCWHCCSSWEPHLTPRYTQTHTRTHNAFRYECAVNWTQTESEHTLYNAHRVMCVCVCVRVSSTVSDVKWPLDRCDCEASWELEEQSLSTAWREKQEEK